MATPSWLSQDSRPFEYRISGAPTGFASAYQQLRAEEHKHELEALEGPAPYAALHAVEDQYQADIGNLVNSSFSSLSADDRLLIQLRLESEGAPKGWVEDPDGHVHAVGVYDEVSSDDVPKS